MRQESPQEDIRNALQILINIELRTCCVDNEWRDVYMLNKDCMIGVMDRLKAALSKMGRTP